MISKEIRAELLNVGLDTDAMIEKFMDSEEMFRKYYGKFFASADEVVKKLAEAVADGDLAQTERSAHALKGLAGNIGLNGVYAPAQKIVNDLRAGNNGEYRRDFEACRKAYETARNISERI